MGPALLLRHHPRLSRQQQRQQQFQQQQQQQQQGTNYNTASTIASTTTTNSHHHHHWWTRMVVYIVLLYTVIVMTYHSMRLDLGITLQLGDHVYVQPTTMILQLDPLEQQQQQYNKQQQTTTTTITTDQEHIPLPLSRTKTSSSSSSKKQLSIPPIMASTNNKEQQRQLPQETTLQQFLSTSLSKTMKTNYTTLSPPSKQQHQPPPNHNNTIIGVLSHQPKSYFDALRAEIDQGDPHRRCRRYGTKLLSPSHNHHHHNKTTTTTTTTPPPRRMFWGSLIADESLELMQIVAAETYGLFEGIVLVESNRTQNFTPRSFQHLNHTEQFRIMFQAQQVLIQPYVNESAKLLDLAREHAQRALIVQGWKQLGMTEYDIGILSDLDETFTRDFLHAVQQCDFPHFRVDHHHHNHHSHECHYHKVKLTATTRVYEGSPECITQDRIWFHPDIISGHCIEGIGHHLPAPRHETSSFERAIGYGYECMKFNDTLHTNNTYHAWNAADFRRTCGGSMVSLSYGSKTVEDQGINNQFRHNPTLFAPYTAYHFHNFFVQYQSTRFKYLTYGHPDKKVMEKPMYNISNDLHMMVHCVKGEPDDNDQKWKRVVGGFNASLPFWPIYFQDPDYRQRRHEHVLNMVLADEEFMKQNRHIVVQPSRPTNNKTALPITTTTTRTKTPPTKTETPPTITEIPAAITKIPAAIKDKPKQLDPSPIEPLQNVTSTGITLLDPELYKATPIGTNSSTSSVIALATGYDLRVYQRFVGSLRKTGYQGHIILGVSPDVSPRIKKYLQRRKVQIQRLRWVNCTYSASFNNHNHTATQQPPPPTQCAHPYPDIKIRWSRYPLARDWLIDCTTCTGPVLLMDARDSVFQRDPFANLSTDVAGLQVYQEDLKMTTSNWLTQWPIRTCKNVTNYNNRPMLCSGTTVGTRAAMLTYLDIMYQEMKVWINNPSCRFDIDGDDQSIHNYLYYSGQLPFAHSMANRGGGIVNTVGHTASELANQHFAYWKKMKHLAKPEAKLIPYEGAVTNRTWIGLQYNITNEEGFLTEQDGTVSRVIHQFDRFHYMYESWLDQQPWATDAIV